MLHTTFAARTLSRGVPQIVTPDHDYTVEATRHRYAAWFNRLALLKKLALDPRWATPCLDVLHQQPWKVLFRDELHDPLFALLKNLADRRVIERLRHLAEHSDARSAGARDAHRERFPKLADAIEKSRWPPLEPDQQERVRTMVRKLAPKRAVPRADPLLEQRLLAAVADNLDDPAPRGVLADLWIERGSPRGELITADEKKARSLIFRHEADWLGPLERVTMHRAYLNGFLDAFTLRVNHAASEELWTMAEQAPDLATVRSIEQGHSNVRHYLAFTLAARNLRSVHMKTRKMLEAFTESDRPRLREVHLEFALDARAVKRLARFPDLRVLVVPNRPDARAIAAPLIQRGVKLTV